MGIETEFQKKFKKARKKQNMTQKKLSETLNISRQAISNYERGKALPNLTTLVDISEILNVSLDYLMGRTQHQVNPYLIENIEDIDESNIENSINSLLSGKTKKEKYFIFKMIKMLENYKEEIYG